MQVDTDTSYSKLHNSVDPITSSQTPNMIRKRNYHDRISHKLVEP